MVLQLLCAVVIVRAFSDEFSVSIPSGGDDFGDDELMDYQAAKDREFTDSSKYFFTLIPSKY